MSLSSPPQAVLHIGLPKTGTTALQQHFFPALPDNRFTYIGTDQPRPNRGGVAYRAIMDALNCPADIRDVRVYQAQAQLAQLPQQKTLVLSEELITVDGLVPWQEKVARLGKIFSYHTCTLVMTVREPRSGLFSLYVELFRSLEIRFPTFADFAASNQSQIFDFHYLASVAHNAFPATCIVLIPFEELRPGGTFLSRLAQVFDIRPPSHLPKENNTKTYYEDAVRIPALSLEQGLERWEDAHPLWLLRKLARLTRRLLRPVGGLLNHIQIPGSERLIKIPEPSCVPLRYAESNNWLLINYEIDYKSVTSGA